MDTIRNVEINQLHDFKNHPYGDGYEVISGHRRKEAAVWAGEIKVPVVIRELNVAKDIFKGALERAVSGVGTCRETE